MTQKNTDNPAEKELREIREIDAQIETLKKRKEILVETAQKKCSHPNGGCGCGVFCCPDCGYDNM